MTKNPFKINYVKEKHQILVYRQYLLAWFDYVFNRLTSNHLYYFRLDYLKFLSQELLNYCKFIVIIFHI